MESLAAFRFLWFFAGRGLDENETEAENMKKIFAVTMVVVLLGAGAAFAGAHHYGPGAGRYSQGPRMGTQEPSPNWLEQAPQNVRDAFRQIDINRSEISLEIAKGSTDSKKMSVLHEDMLKAKRAISDYYFDQTLKNPEQAGKYAYGDFHRMGKHAMGYGTYGGLHAGLHSELSKANPDTARAKQMYLDTMNLSEKHARERFELMLKYPEGMGVRHRGPVF